MTEEQKKKQKKCKYCKGRGLVIIDKGIKGLKECPYCNGTGVAENEVGSNKRNG